MIRDNCFSLNTNIDKNDKRKINDLRERNNKRTGEIANFNKISTLTFP